ncbi:MAG: glycosyltransferase [Anaeroplasmataceae bacterium]|nr:glycosyltransferase [Anaeroplasmataceae bacterium]MDE6415227.1 glycosyltransferase [Anaeroplasmataceae bacterium]
MKKISILLTNRNQGNKVFSSMENIVKQTYPNLEILILNAGYKNEGIEYIRELQAQYNNIFVYEKKYASLNSLRKLGLSKATGDYVLFLLPDDILNLNAVSVLAECIEKENADIAVGSFFHPYYNHYLENSCYEFDERKSFIFYERDIFSNAMLTGKLYKKSLFKDVQFKDIFLNESLINLQVLKKTNKIITTEKILFVCKEHYTLFETSRFWENKQSFWYKCQPALEYSIKIFNRNKKLFTSLIGPEAIYLHALDYLLWELLVYAIHSASIESLTMELYQVLEDSFFLSCLEKIPLEGLMRKKLNQDETLANCILYADLLIKNISSLQERISQISILKVCYMIFLKLFYRQVNALNTNYFLCSIREELNLNESKEAKYVNSLNL